MGCALFALHDVNILFLSKSGVCRFMDEESHGDPVEPRNGAAVEVVDLEEDERFSENFSENFFRSMLHDGQDTDAFAPPQLDSISEGTLGDWDTSLVETNCVRQEDKAVSKRDYESLLMTARLSAIEDDQLKLPWESGIFKSIFSDDSMVSLLPTQVLSVPGDVLCGPSQEGASSSGAMPEPKQFAWLSRDIVLPIHICAIKVLPDRDFLQELDVLWVHAVDKWLRVFEILGYSGLLGEALASELCLPGGGRSREMVRDSMGIKSPRTAIKRAQTGHC